MKFTKTTINNTLIIEQDIFTDHRGSFIKVFNDKLFKEHGLNFQPAESFYSESVKNVIRGMHFQEPPFEHDKIATVVQGKVLDVILDIRKHSTTYGQHIKVELSRENHKSIYIPKGCAHGFLSESDSSIVFYMTSSCYNAQYDKGIKWDSFSCDWPVDNPIISDRDSSFQPFRKYKSPF